MLSHLDLSPEYAGKKKKKYFFTSFALNYLLIKYLFIALKVLRFYMSLGMIKRKIVDAESLNLAQELSEIPN